jgi:ribose transport system substrate-binding protein
LIFGGTTQSQEKTEEIMEEGSIVFMPLKVDDTDEVQPIGGTGPNGETPVGVEALENLLTEEDAQKIKSEGYTAAVCMHFTANDWSQLQIKGIKATLEKYGIELLTVTDGQLKIEKQIADYESALSLNPDLIISIPLDANATGPVLRKAVEKGVKLSFIDSVPHGFVSPQDYAGMGTADNYANGRVAAEILAEHLGGKGEVALANYKYDQFHVRERTRGARETFAKYPDITIVAEIDVENPEEAANKTESLLIAHPELDGLWTVWDGAGMAAAGVIQNLGKQVAVTTVDLSYDSAYSIASGGLLIGTGAQHPYDQGVAEALLGIAALAGKETPPYVLIPGEKVTQKSMKRSWYRVFRSDMPKELKQALEETGAL